MKISRRDFLKWCTASATAIGVTKIELDKLESVVMAAETTPPVIWLQGSSCSGCTISLLNAVENTTIDNFLLNQVSMKYHSNLMVVAGKSAMAIIDDAIKTYSGQFILIVEGAIPTANNGNYCILGERNGKPWTILEAVKELAPHAKYIVSAGTCSSFGGVPKLGSNPTGISNVSDVLSSLVTSTSNTSGSTKKSMMHSKTQTSSMMHSKTQTSSGYNSKLINLPGCPVHPYTLTKTLIDLLLYGMPKLTGDRSPKAYYSTSVHHRCPRMGTPPAKELGQSTCLKHLGCQGPHSKYDCPIRKWNNKTNWCVGASNTCIKCASKDFGSKAFYTFK